MSRKSRDKGASFERSVARLLTAWSGESFRRTPLSGGWDRQRAPGDIVTPDWWPWPIECKAREEWNWSQIVRGIGPWWDWWVAAETEAREAGRPGHVLVFTRNREPAYLAMPSVLVSRLMFVGPAPAPLVTLPLADGSVYLLETWLDECSPDMVRAMAGGG